MANDPKAAKEKRGGQTDRPNAKGDHEGSAHSPDAFDTANPQKQVPPAKAPPEKP